MDNNNGFTLTELLVVTAIVLIFSGIGLTRYNNYTQELKLKNEVKKLVDVIELTKKKAVSSDLYDQSCTNFNGYTITLNLENYVLKFGCNGIYQTIQTYNFITNISAVIVSPPQILDFKPLGVGTNLTVNTVRLKNTVVNQCQDISISSIGIIEPNETLISC